MCIVEDSVIWYRTIRSGAEIRVRSAFCFTEAGNSRNSALREEIQLLGSGEELLRGRCGIRRRGFIHEISEDLMQALSLSL